MVADTKYMYWGFILFYNDTKKKRFITMERTITYIIIIFQAVKVKIGYYLWILADNSDIHKNL